MKLHRSLLLASIVQLSWAIAPGGIWDAFNYAPHSRTVSPRSIIRTEGEVSNPQNLLGLSKGTTFSSNGAYVTLDFGQEVSTVSHMLVMF